MAVEPGAPRGEGAFKTIGEVATLLGLPQHILRYWETRFPQLKPLQRAGNRRYYRPADVALVQRIDQLLNREGYTVRGVQMLLEAEPGGGAAVMAAVAPPTELPLAPAPALAPAMDLAALRAIRDHLATALAED